MVLSSLILIAPSLLMESMLPLLVAQWFALQDVAVLLPLWEELIHVSLKTIVMMTLQEMYQFMHQDVLQALDRLLSEF